MFKGCLVKIFLFAVLLSTIAFQTELPANAATGQTTKFIDNPHWIESTSTEITQIYNASDTFVVMVYRTTCFNSGLRKTVVIDWMNEYDIDVYGLDCDQYGIPQWIRNALPGSSVTLPVIAIVNRNEVSAYDANTGMREIQQRLNEVLGVYSDMTTDFLTVGRAAADIYSTHSAAIMKRYVTDLPEVSVTIEAAALEIVDGCSTEREKLRAIYDWVTTNLSYNHNMLDGTESRRTSAEATFLYKDSVCEGFANLTRAMCQAVGIPCRVVTGFGTGMGTDEIFSDVWEAYLEYLSDGDIGAFADIMRRSGYVNHAWNEAFIDGRWVILDTTWDCNNEIIGNGIIRANPTSRYFDIPLEDFCETHLFWTQFPSDLTVSLLQGGLTVSGVLDDADRSGGQYLLAAYDTAGRMLHCAEVHPSRDGSFAGTLSNCAQAAIVKLFVLHQNGTTRSPAYLGILSA